MAHELSINQEGKAEAMFAGQVPWHGLGTMVEELQEPMKALELANMNWKVVKKDLYYGDDVANRQKVPHQVGTVRADTGAYLGTVGKNYVPIQNEEQAKFISDLLGTGEAVVECVGALYGGAWSFWTCRLPKTITVLDGDVIKEYLILANSHAGDLTFRAFWSPIRVVCKNTLNAALHGVTNGVAIYHTLNAASRVSEAQSILKIADSYYLELQKEFQELAKKKIEEPKFFEFVNEVFPNPEPAKEPGKALKAVREQIHQNYLSGPGADIAGKTPYGAYNAVTQFVSHQQGRAGRIAKNNPGRFSQNQFASIISGDGRKLQQKAFAEAKKLALV